MKEQVRGMGSKCGSKTGGWDMEGSGGTKEGGMGGGG